MIELEAKIMDSPGALLEFLKPIAENSGNIYGIFHTHKEKLGSFVPVLVRFEIISEKEVECLENIKTALQNLNIQITKITDIPAVHLITVILSGHVFRSNVEEIVVRLKNLNAKVFNLDARFTDPDAISNVKFMIEIPDEIDDKVIMEELRKICAEKDLYLLREEKL